LRDAVGRGDPWVLLGALAVGVGAGIGAVGQLFYLGAKEIAIDPHYCGCARAAEQIISRGQVLGMLAMRNDGCLWGRWSLPALVSS
jgi:hypothetical protein